MRKISVSEAVSADFAESMKQPGAGRFEAEVRYRTDTVIPECQVRRYGG